MEEENIEQAYKIAPWEAQLISTEGAGKNSLEKLKLLREPFLPHQISKLPKGTKAQNECPANEKIVCKICGGWHHPRVIHLDYVGHAALTDRLLDVDPQWFWEPMALKEGLPAFDTIGGLWIYLTVCGVRRIGYGNAAAATFRTVGDREKEAIGDALRNAAMRFGAALDLWHKGDLHVVSEGSESPSPTNNERLTEEGLASVPSPEAVEPPETLLPNSSLHRKIEALISEAEINRELFKQWLFEKGKIKLEKDRISLNTMTVENAEAMCDAWKKTVVAFRVWIRKQSQEGI